MFNDVDGEASVWMDDKADYHSKTRLVTGDFAFVRTGVVHASHIHRSTKVFGTGTAGFERFIHAIGQPTYATKPDGVCVADFAVMRGAGEKCRTQFMPEFHFSD